MSGDFRPKQTIFFLSSFQLNSMPCSERDSLARSPRRISMLLGSTPPPLLHPIPPTLSKSLICVFAWTSFVEEQKHIATWWTPWRKKHSSELTGLMGCLPVHMVCMHMHIYVHMYICIWQMTLEGHDGWVNVHVCIFSAFFFLRVDQEVEAPRQVRVRVRVGSVGMVIMTIMTIFRIFLMVDGMLWM